MSLDPVLLSRLQFFWVIGLHILQPAFTIGLACYIALLEGLYLRTGNAVYLRISAFWVRIFAIAFGLGVVSGIVMAFQFGTNWSRFSDAAGNVVGPLMAYEALTAFFLEASFLGVLLFGRNLVPADRTRAAPDPARRPARAEHAGVSAGEARGDGRRLGDAERHAPRAVRLA